ncbi:MAG: hypothetical protein A2W23_02770 [Planctomycetes bacterium RBG_16_43_13]|nr:MAG: hypothetical protein A2W23_02770 [Planctomycetes bacterium RBG_16_43_13]
MMKHTFYIAILLFCSRIEYVVFAQDTNNCGKCHQKEQNSEANSIHIQEGVGCADCHGGNGKGGIKGTAHGEGFLGKIPRQDIPKLCAKCHSDVRKMNPYGLSTDQYAQYLTSKHGEALVEGKTDVATCIDCHNTHGIKRVRDPQSPVYPKNVPSTCAKCHSNKELMDKYGLPATAETLYKQSIHADLLLNKDDLSAPTCATCHGNHGAVPPGFAEISHTCGKCHIKQQDLFKESPHAPLVAEGTFKGCVTCHSNHKISRTPKDIFKRCSTCHEEGDKAIKERDTIFTLIESAEGDFQKTKDRLGQLTRAGFHTEDEELLLEEAKTSILQLPPVQHTLNLENVRKLFSTTESTLSDIQRQLDKKEKVEEIKKFALVPIWLFLIGMAIAFWAKKKSIEKDGR